MISYGQLLIVPWLIFVKLNSLNSFLQTAKMWMQARIFVTRHCSGLRYTRIVVVGSLPNRKSDRLIF